VKISTILTSTLVAASASIFVTPASADMTDWRQYKQQQRIEQGVRSGQITRHEYHRLQGEQARIAEIERRAKRDGYVDPWERAQIRQAQNHASRRIYVEKHDGDSRWNRWRRWW
jgi:hypothetical protein